MKYYIFYCEWCGPSIALLCTLKYDFADVPVEFIECESNADVAKKNQIREFPTLLRIGEDGKEKRLVGNQAHETLQSFFGMRHT